jgi:cyanophycinase
MSCSEEKDHHRRCQSETGWQCVPSQRLGTRVLKCVILGLLLCCLTLTSADDTPKHGLAATVTTPPPVEVEGIGPGTLIIQGGGETPQSIVDAFLKKSGGEKTRLVIIPTASADAAKTDSWLPRWKERGITDITVLHTNDRKLASTPEFVKPLQSATGVFITGGDQIRLSDAYAGTLVEEELKALLKRGGAIWGTSAGAAIQSKLMIASGKPPEVKMAPGLGLLPGAIIDQHFVVRKREPRLLNALKQFPGFVGFGIDEATALVVQGRSLRVVGDSTVTVIIQSNADRPLRKEVLDSKTVSDLTMLRKAAMGRTEQQYPPKHVTKPNVPSGSLVIVGGGGMPADVVNKYIELAGGKEKTFVVLPTSMPDPVPSNTGSFLRRAGVKNVHVLTGRTRAEVTKPETLELLDKADAIWFDGGRQWRFVDAYEGTPFVEKLKGVLQRGGVIGGSSAGATIQGEYLCRGSPLGPQHMVCEGYEKGFAFLPGVGIDQHFTQRNRFKDMLLFKKTYPQYLGIGIDEATAIVVQKQRAEVIGKSRVCFYTKEPATEQDFISVKAGEAFDLSTLTPVK